MGFTAMCGSVWMGELEKSRGMRMLRLKAGAGSRKGTRPAPWDAGAAGGMLGAT